MIGRRTFIAGATSLLLAAPATAQETPTFVTAWGKTGSEPGEFLSPEGIAVSPGGYVFVADTRNSRVQKFDLNGHFLAEWPVAWIHDIDVDPEGNVLTVGESVQRFTISGTSLAEWQPGGSGIAVSSQGFIYVVDPAFDTVSRFTSQGELLIQWGSSGHDFGGFDTPLDIAVDKNENVYVTDLIENRVQKFSASGQLLKVFDPPGGSAGWIYSPAGIRIIDGEVLVVSHSAAKVLRYSEDGVFLSMWGEIGAAEGELGMPFNLDVDPDGCLYITDLQNDRIQKFSTRPVSTAPATWGRIKASPWSRN